MFILEACNTCNHLVAIDYNLIGSRFIEFACLLRVGSVL